MRHEDGPTPPRELARHPEREFEWSAEMVTAETLEKDERLVHKLIADFGRGLAKHQASGDRIRILTQMIDRLSRATVTDFLTGLRNRQGFVRDGSLLLSQAAVRDRYATVFFFDVDRLKAVNDQAGHAAGDDLLRCAARALHATFRASDITGRLGGDEFAAITLARRDDAAPGILERLARAVRDINAERKTWPLQLSAGVAIADPGSTLSLGQLLDHADRLMYQDKRSRSSPRFRLIEGRASGARRPAATGRRRVECIAKE
jgi:diguanylate cyclase (GGDEF)-like protein